jgi:HAD superfamily hydrolase (TIGR01509 family)
MPAQLLIFDCDGVLVDSEPIAARVLAEALVEFGLDESPESVDDRFRGRSVPDIVRQLEEQLGRSLPSDFGDKLGEKTRVAFEMSLSAVSGVRELLLELTDRGIDMCVASSGSLEKISHSLTLTELLPFFEGRIFSAHQVRRGKPAPDLFLHAAKRMGYPISNCTVIEDSSPGVAGAVLSGARVLGYVAPQRPDSSERRRHLEKLGATVFHHMKEVPRLAGLPS